MDNSIVYWSCFLFTYVTDIYVNHDLLSFDLDPTVTGIFYGSPSTFLNIFGRNIKCKSKVYLHWIRLPRPVLAAEVSSLNFLSDFVLDGAGHPGPPCFIISIRRHVCLLLCSSVAILPMSSHTPSHTHT